MNRAYSVIDIKAIDEEQRILEGIATTPSTDRMEDVIESAGAVYALPIPLLWQHGKDPFVGQTAVGHVFAAKATSTGIPVRIQMERTDEPGRLKDILDFAWQATKKRLVRGLSIGFRPLEAPEAIKGTFGLRYKKWEWLELSAVTIPANTDATIQLIKSIDTQDRAASGEGQAHMQVGTPGVAGTVVRLATKGATSTMKTYSDQIQDLDNKRAANAARLNDIQQKASDEGRTKDDAEKDEFKTLQTEIAAIDDELVDLRAMEKMQIVKAVPVAGKTIDQASASRGGTTVEVKSTLPKGTGFTRYAMALAAGRGSRMEAAEYAKRWDNSTPEVALILKAAVSAGTTTDSDWAAPLVVYQNLASEFVELLRPQTIIGRIPGLRRVPFNVTMPTQTQGATAGWVGQGKPKPVSELKFGQISLGMAKAAGIVVLSEELVRSSNPSAEAIVSQDLRATISQFLDLQFIDPGVAAVANVSPASITNGITPVEATGTTAAAFRTDVKTLLAGFTAANLSLSGSVWIMTETQAQALAMMQNALGQPEFPNITMTGGTLFGLPVVTSENIPAEGASPAGERIILVKANEILFADDGGVTLDVSREASLQMNSTPDDPATASTVMVNLWQNNLVGLRAERYINWVRRRDAAVGIIEGAVYVG